MIARSFFLLATLFLVFGLCLGIYMGASGDHRLATVHAHTNLLGFVLMMLFGLVYHAVPRMADSRLASAHLWLHFIGALGLLLMLALYMLDRISADTMPLSAPFQIAILLGALVFLTNLWRHYRV